MSFLFPAALIGLAAIAAPILIHLIARHRYPVQDFPSLSLLRYERRDNAFARRLVDPLQLLLRILLLALLALAMSRLFMPSDSDDPAPRNLVVVVDSSASMQILSPQDREEEKEPPIEQARAIATELLGGISPPSRCALIIAGDEVKTVTPLDRDPAPALAALEELRTGDGTGAGLVQAIAQGAELVRGRREVKSQVVVITDRRASAFETRNQSDIDALASLQEEMDNQLEVVIVDVGGQEAANLAITYAELRDRRVRIGDDAHIVTTMHNYGVTNQETRLTVSIGGRKERPGRMISMDPGDKVVVDITARVKRAVRGFASVATDGKDAARHDDLYSVPFLVEPSRRILVVNGTAESGGSDADSALSALSGGVIEQEEELIDGARILQYALNPGRELGRAFGTGLDTEQVTPEALAAQTLSKYDTIMLYDVSSLTEPVMRDLATFVEEGRSMVIICSATINPNEFNATLGAPGRERAALSPVKIGIDLTLDPPVAMDIAGGFAHDFGDGVSYEPGLWVAPFRDRREGDLSIMRFRRLRKAVAIEPGAVVRLQGGGYPLAVEAVRGEGRVVVMLYGMELSRGNIAMTKVFPLLTWRLMDYIGGRLQRRPPDTLTAATPAALAVTEPAFRFMEVFELARAAEQPFRAGGPADAESGERNPGEESEPLAMTAGEQRTVFVPGVRAGNYWLRKQRSSGFSSGSGYARPITVNPDSRESHMQRSPDEDLQSLLSDRVRLVTPAEVASLTPHGSEFWRWVVIALVALYLVEAIAAYVTGVIRDRRQEALEEEDA